MDQQQSGTTGVQTHDWNAGWAAVRERMRRELGDPVFDAWINPLNLEGFDGNDLKIGARKPFIRNWVANHYVGRIEKAFKAEGFTPTSLNIVIAAMPAPRPDTGSTPYETLNGNVHAKESTGLWSGDLNPQQTFSRFVIGPGNEFGYKAVQSFATTEQTDVPLLCLHGDFGFGKTHLLNAAALEFRNRGKQTLFLRAEDFMRHFLGALYRKDTLAFKEELRTAEVLILDDLQHICRSSATSKEFLYTVKAFADLRRRVVIAADRAPLALESIGDDVKSLLSGGLCVGLDMPDRDTRFAIVKARAAEYTQQKPAVILSGEVLERIVDVPGASPRELIGIFTKVATYADLTKKPVMIEMVEDIVGHSMPGAKTSIEDIQRKAAEFYKLDLKDFWSLGRARRVARPRQVAMYLSRKLTTRSLPEIGRRFGGRDHTTVLHSCRRIEALMAEDALFKQEVDFLHQMLQRRPDI